ncbi:histidine kinase [Pseudoflavitalea sp. X16]|uniref:sensor histidine kinase n=1 Tax=Paraflavitalea devenefica TaxID=2716334 RepID=UPI00141ECF68|nr:histidine kinase [Paraflavitalea devenefica]NII25646.1 histidine kinase [Paraflavitalea devenefica]
MKLFKKGISIVQVQVIVWICITLLMFLLIFHEGQSIARSASFAICNAVFYAALMYTNACWMVPKFYRRQKKWLYVVLVLLLMAVTTWAIIQAQVVVMRLLPDKGMEKAMKPVTIPLRYYFVTFFLNILILLFSLPLRLAFDYFTMRKQQEQLKKRTAEAELNLLKAQVQPHFLFNTLNNIYFVAQRESPTTAGLLERLSNIMRYFVDEGPKDKIGLAREIDFIRDYIHLEKMRMRHPMQIEFDIKGEVNGVSIPPMLLIPLVENVFKHGINKRSEANFLQLDITVEAGRLDMKVRNRIFEELEPASHGGNGLVNLQSRLELLYGGQYTLHTEKQEGLFLAHLNIPL